MPGGSFEKSLYRADLADVLSDRKTVDLTSFNALPQPQKDAITNTKARLRKNPLIRSAVVSLATTLRETAAQPEAEKERAVRIALAETVADLQKIEQEFQDLGFFPPDSPIETPEELVAVRAIIEHLLELRTPAEIRYFIDTGLSEKKAVSELSQDQREVLRSLPNDFQRFLYGAGVPLDVLRSQPPETATPHERHEFFREKYHSLFERFLGIIAYDAKFNNNNEADNLQVPAFAHFHLDTIPEGREKEYSVEELMGVAKSALPKEEAHAVEEEDTFFIDFFNVNNMLAKTFKEFTAAASGADNLVSFWFPLEDESKKQNEQPTWFDAYFWNTLFDTWGDVHLHYPAPNAHGETEWQQSDKSAGQLLFEAVQRILAKGIQFYPGQRQPLSLTKPLKGYRPQLRHGTSWFVREKNGERQYATKMVKLKAIPPDAFFPYAQEPDPGKKDVRRKTKQKIVQQLVYGLPNSANQEVLSRYFVNQGGGMLDVWMEGAYQDSPLKPARDDITWQDLFGMPLDQAKLSPPGGGPSRWDEAFTVRRARNVFPAPGVAEDRVDGLPEGTYTNLTDIELWVLQGKLTAQPTGIRWTDKFLTAGQYADKAITSETSQTTEFQTRMIGKVKSFLIPFGRYYRDNRSGRTINDILLSTRWSDIGPKDLPPGAVRAPTDPRRIVDVLVTGATSNYGAHVKDAVHLSQLAIGELPASLLNIGEVDIKTNIIGKINTKLLSALRGWHQTARKYHLKRDLDPNSVSREKIKDYQNLGPNDNIGDQFVIVRLENEAGDRVQTVTRAPESYYLAPQDLYDVLDQKLMGNGSYAVIAPPENGVPVISIKVSGREPVKQEQVDQLMMREILRTFLYAWTNADVLEELKTETILLIGMIFSSEMRQKFEKGEYSRGPLGRTTVSIVTAAMQSLKTYFHIEIPDIVGADLLTEEVYIRMLYQIGYVRNKDDFTNDLKSNGGELLNYFK